MGEQSGIEWTTHTWNPWRGCTKVSAGCDNCYMFREQTRFGSDPSKVVRCSESVFRKPLGWNRKAGKQQTLKNIDGGKLEVAPTFVFTCSWSDFFHKGADAWRDEAWDIVRRTPWLTYQVLTKRPSLIASRLPVDWGEGYPNVWLGVSVEDQETADRRIPQLLNCPASVRFVSYEPALGPVDFSCAFAACDRHREPSRPRCNADGSPAIGWVIVGGESGLGARPFEVVWAERTITQCREAGVACFVKQLGGDPAEWPEGLRVRQMPDPHRRRQR